MTDREMESAKKAMQQSAKKAMQRQIPKVTGERSGRMTNREQKIISRDLGREKFHRGYGN
jgi:hypothetical protein